jgi:hypothetical protein
VDEIGQRESDYLLSTSRCQTGFQPAADDPDELKPRVASKTIGKRLTWKFMVVVEWLRAKMVGGNKQLPSA